MKKFLKRLIYVVIISVLIVVVGISYLVLVLPGVGKPEDIKVELTPQRIERGKYLANSVANCMGCHSAHDGTFAFPDIPDSLGSGGDTYDKSIGYPGLVYVPNITPFNLKGWTDGEIFRAITCGVKKDGSVIYPLMPWQQFSKMGREDIYAIIAYLRTLKSVSRSYPARRLNFLTNILVNTYPEKATLTGAPDTSDRPKYGAYLVSIADCAFCHTRTENDKPIKGMEFAGGVNFSVSDISVVHSANLTPDTATGIGSWTKDMFVSRFAPYDGCTLKPWKVKEGEFQSFMPWWNYGGMKKSDLAAIYAYLRTLKPVKNTVVKFTLKKEQQGASN
jgi:mono/diheme cytochrome c family protein